MSLAARKKGLSAGLDKQFTTAVKQLTTLQNELPFFPEIITYEEMNLNRPSNLKYKILEMAFKMDKTERIEFLKFLPEILKEIKEKRKKQE